MEVILGALIALAGSSLIPWLRDALSARRLRADDRERRRDDALVELIAKNARFAIAWTGKDAAARALAMEERSRASMRLLLTIDDVDTRASFSRLMNTSIPHSSGDTADAGTDVGAKLAVLQDVLVRWSAGEIAARDLASEFDRRMGRKKAN